MNTGTAGIKKQVVGVGCRSCFLRFYQRLFTKFNTSEQIQKEFLEYFDIVTTTLAFESAPEVQRDLSMKFCKLTGIEDLFVEEKHMSNLKATEIYNKWKPIISEYDDVFKATLRLAIAGNIMDYGAGDYFDIESVITEVFHAEFAIDYSRLLKEKIKSSEKILYLGDNAGEIVFDKLFIETNLQDKVVYVVKGGPVLNDVTMADAEAVNMESVAKVITNGYNAPSTVLSMCSPDFMHHFNSADLIISKGQGNFEGLWSENDSRVFFLLMTKCDTVSDILGVNKGSFVVINGGHRFEK